MINDPPDFSDQATDDADGRLEIFNVRAELWQDRLPMLEAAMRAYKPDLVILDGIRDLVNDINDGVMAQDVVERLMHLASDLHCCLVCILHQNKSAEDKNLRGWIGTELMNKAFEVYECTKNQDRIFAFRQNATRKYDIIDDMRYTVDEVGIPQLCSVEPETTTASHSAPAASAYMSRPEINKKYLRGYDDNNRPIIDIEALFIDAFRPGESKSYAQLMATVMNMANITSRKFYSYRLKDALSMGAIVCQSDDEGGKVYLCPSKPAVPVPVPERRPDPQGTFNFSSSDQTDQKFAR